ncbi:hypothetical protein ACFYWU_42200 [Streptomyces chrestomyceticus]|uniref:hypothetical protein n=1 Tax=Streptomyces chrestomyceticus TaxID=68185 RepID=UPI00368EBB7C
MQQLTTQGLAQTNGKHGQDLIRKLTPAGPKALAASNEPAAEPPRAGTGARSIRAGFGPHGIAVPSTIR